jgi:putative transposase
VTLKKTNSSLPEKKKKKQKPKELQAAKAIKIRVLPSEDQKRKLNAWIGTTRWTYNQGLTILKDEGIKGNLDIKILRSRVVNNDLYKDKPELKWVLETPYDVRDDAIRDLIKAYSSNFANKKLNPEHTFDIKYKSKRRATSEQITLHGKHIKLDPDHPREFQIHPKSFDQRVGSLLCAERLPLVTNQYDCRLIKERTGHWYLCIPLPLNYVYDRAKPVSQIKPITDSPRVVAIDPGVRTFLTCYSPDGDLFEVGTNNDMDRMHSLCQRIDKIQSLCDTKTSKNVKSRTRYRLKKRSHKLRKEIKDLRSELHRKTAKLLVAHYDTIMLPKFETSQMVEHNPKRVINNTTVRKMLTWSHYGFQQLLIAKAREIPGTKVLIVDESHTTMTCGICGLMNRGIGGAKEYTCPECNTRHERDWTAARNVFIKNHQLLL